MSHIEKAGNEGLLAYGLSTHPSPLQISPKDGNPSMASMVVTVSNNTHKPIWCNKLTFGIPIGKLAQDLTDDATGILVSANPSSEWQISQTTSGVFVATPTKPEYEKIAEGGISFQIFNIPVNKQVGTFTLGVTESSSTNGSDFTDKSNKYDLAKFPYGFYVGNFAASSPLVGHGEPVTLTWNGADIATYTMIFADKTADVTNVRTWESPPLKQPTTFSLKASTQQNGETVDTYLFVTVMVSQPDVTATSLSVLETTDLTGPATLASTLNVAGVSTMGEINGGGLSLSGGATVNELVVSAGAQIGGTAAMVNASLSGSLSVDGSVGLMKGMTLLASGSSIPQKNYTANSDGFLISQMGWTSDPTTLAFAWAHLYTGSNWFLQTGGNTLNYNGWNNYYGSNPQIACLPVARGSTFAYKSQQYDGNDENPTMSFYWFPNGGGGYGETYEELAEAPADIPPSPVAYGATMDSREERTERATVFVRELERAMGRELDGGPRLALAAKLAEV